MGHLAGAETKSGQQKKHRLIPQFEDVPVTRTDDSLNVLRSEEPRERRDRACGKTREGMFHSEGASFCCPEEAKIGADRDDNAVGSPQPVKMCPIIDESAQSLSGIAARIISQGLKEPHQDHLIGV
jgi:hypothetical protein